MCLCSGKVLGSCGYAAMSLLHQNGSSDFAKMEGLNTLCSNWGKKNDPRTQCNGGDVFLFTTCQTTLRYNIHLEKQQSAFALRVQTVPLTCDNPNGHNSFQISLEIRYEISVSLSLYEHLSVSISICLCLSTLHGTGSKISKMGLFIII